MVVSARAWAIEFADSGALSERLWPDRDSACRWASRELGPGQWQAVEVPAFELPAPAAHGIHGEPTLHYPLTEVELVTLDILSSLKPFARAEEMARWGCGDYKALANGGRLQRMGFYAVSRAGAITPDRDRIKHALRQHDRPENIRSLDCFASKYYGQALNPFKPSEQTEPQAPVDVSDGAAWDRARGKP